MHDADRDGQAERIETLLDGLKVAHGIALHPSTGALYIVEQHRVTRLDDPLASDVDEADLRSVFDGLPDKSWHGWRPAAFGPDGKLYMGVGAPCNICQVDGLEGTITRIDQDGGNVEVYAAGVRNTVGFDWHPSTGELWFTDNGGDNMGDHRPPDELNHAPEPGHHFGFPYVWGTAEEPYPRQGRAPRETTPAAVDFQAHAAALGIEFYEGTMFPEAYRNDAFVAMHGSWNRSPSDPAGYRIMRIRFDPAGRATGKEVFIDGFLTPEKDYWGRPVHFAELPDGSLLLSDDASGALYRITYAAP